MDVTLVPTLKDTAMLKAALLLYNEDEAIELEKFVDCKSSLEEHLNKILNYKVSTLDLPVQLQETLVVIATRVGIQIRERNLTFNSMHEDICKKLGHECHCLEGTLQNYYRWDSNGFADDQKILQALIEDQRIDVAYRFTLACEFNYINDLRHIWEQMSQALKNRLKEDDVPVILKFWVLMSLKREDMSYRDGFDMPLFLLFRSLQRLLQRRGYTFYGLEDDIKGWITWFSAQWRLASCIFIRETEG
ncbi:hypothetical protein AVEN_176893-1 [Araneus ventricosus]|uniref:Uncharacterized protein n=1 Tax=Araneus ventricosus TaxID=182803 RepID=A0A4Y2NCA2_ARAVE|nr:hypothetical protein AVEN_176893-1 [Araneus ventricosus]